MRGFRNLRDAVEVPLAPSPSGRAVLTLSGANGSGKSAVAEGLAALQRAALIRVMGARDDEGRSVAWERAFLRRLTELVAEDTAAVVLLVGEGNEASRITLNVDLSNRLYPWELDVEPGPAERLYESWSSRDPRNLVVLVPSTKYFDQADMMFTDIQIDDVSPVHWGHQLRDDPRYSLLMDPGDALRQAYRRMIEDWYLERLVPSKVPKTVFNAIARVLFSKLVPDVAIGNFSTSTKSGQIVAQAKRTGPRRGRNYDVRGLSSGEKYLYFVFNYVSRFIGRAGLLVIDEPDTHLHESTLSEFLSMLYALTDSNTPGPGVVRAWAADSGMDLQEGMSAALTRTCPANQVVFGAAMLLTHSKMLVRSNLADGRNFLLQHNRISELAHDSVETDLRGAGLSQIDERAVFVEGDKDVKLFESALLGLRVDVRSGDGSAGVMAAFEGFARVDSGRKLPGFAFVIDRDRTNETKYARLKARFPLPWQRHVVVLDRLELENYLLEPRAFLRGLDAFLDDDGRRRFGWLLTEEAIDKVLRRFADMTRELLMQQYLNERIEHAVNHVGQAARSKPADIQSAISFQAFAIGVVFGDEAKGRLQSEIAAAFSDAESKYSGDSWEANWRALCKGKRVFADACDEIARVAGLGPALGERIKKLALRDPHLELAVVVGRILDALEVPLEQRRRLALGPPSTASAPADDVARRRVKLRSLAAMNGASASLSKAKPA